MARQHKQGLDYFPLDIDFFDDDKIQLVSAEFGIKSEAVIIRLMALIYKNGYWYRWGNDECLLLAKRVGESGAFVGEVVMGLVRRSFFNEGVFNSFQVLTSRGIQRRYFEAVIRRKEVDVWENITLYDIKPLMSRYNVSINPVNANINSQSKVEYSKEKEKKSKEGLAADAAGEDSKAKDVTPHWNILKELWADFYKKKFNDLEPTFNGGAAAALKSILKRLQQHSSVTTRTKDFPWTEDYAKKVFTHFLQRAYSDTWRAQNFRLSILSSHYDSIITGNETGNTKTGKPATGANVDSKSAYSKIDGMYGGT